MYVIAITNQKGGVAKTTTAVNLAAGLAAAEYCQNPEKPNRVLFITLDPQADGVDIIANRMLLRDGDKQEAATESLNGKSMADLMVDDDPPPAVTLIRNAKIPKFISSSNLDYIPVDPAAMNNAMQTIVTVDAREYRLREAIEPLERLYKYVVVDTPTTLNIFTLNALTAATHFIIPLPPVGASLRYLKDLEATVRRVKKRLNPNLQLLGILPSKSVLNRAETKNVLEELELRYAGIMFEPVCERADVQMAYSSGLDIFSYKPSRQIMKDFVSDNLAAQEFGAFVKEVTRRLAGS